MNKLVVVFVALILSLAAFGQDNPEKLFGIKFKGYVKNDIFLDTRQTVSAREGHFLLWPSPVVMDANGNDINEGLNLNMLAVQSRLSGVLSGPDALGAKTSGLIEGDFFAQANDNINLFRLRHAFVKLNWKNTELLTGQYWNPLFATGCFPGTVSFNTGTPFQSFARNPQIRVTQNIGNLKMVFALLSQRDYSSRGADGPSSNYLRNSGLPDLHFQIQYLMKNSNGFGIDAGAAIAYKEICPRLSTVDTVDNVAVKYKVDERVPGLTLMAYAKLSTKPVTVKLQGRYGQNITDVLSVSGFAVKDILDPVTGEQSYTPLHNITVWGELHTNGKKFQAGIFMGILMNLGTVEPMSDASNAVYGLGQTISNLYRVSPRVIYNVGKFRLAFELETTIADYGSNFDVNYIPKDLTRATNIRGLLSTYYFF
ncbi:MAG: hypothetical protein K9H26_14455 [Prolixibacteraceae bacterium]|nr:hypothetical protein [Prolixibacteraceae bacterium]